MHTENKDFDPRSLQPGQELQVPTDDAEEGEVSKKEERSAALQEVSISQKSVAFLLKL